MLAVISGPSQTIPARPDPDFEGNLIGFCPDIVPDGPIDAREYLSGNMPDGAAGLILTEHGILARTTTGTSIAIHRRGRAIPLRSLRETRLRRGDRITLVGPGGESELAYEPDAGLSKAEMNFQRLARFHGCVGIGLAAILTVSILWLSLDSMSYLDKSGSGSTVHRIAAIRSGIDAGVYPAAVSGISPHLNAAFKGQASDVDRGKPDSVILKSAFANRTEKLRKVEGK